MPNKAFDFKLQELNDDLGEFIGWASTYDTEPDLGGDIIDPGAFDRTLSKSATRPLLWQHSSASPIGTVRLTDTAGGLLAEGRLSLGIAQARDALVLLKDGIVRGLSIGYESIKEKTVDGIRHLSEIRLWECSLVTFPMNESATVTSVKAAQQAAHDAALRRELKNFRNEVLKALR